MAVKIQSVDTQHNYTKSDAGPSLQVLNELVKIVNNRLAYNLGS
jgi:hypothetical protein